MRRSQRAAPRRNGRERTSGLPANAEIVGVHGGNEIQQSGDDNKFGSVIGGGKLDRRASKIENAADGIEEAVAKVADKAQHVENIAGIGRIELALHGNAQPVHGGDGKKEQK